MGDKRQRMAISLIFLTPTRREKVEVKQKARLSPEREKTRKIKRQGMANSPLSLTRTFTRTPCHPLPTQKRKRCDFGSYFVK